MPLGVLSFSGACPCLPLPLLPPKHVTFVFLLNSKGPSTAFGMLPEPTQLSWLTCTTLCNFLNKHSLSI